MNRFLRNLVCISVIAFISLSCSDTKKLHQILSDYEVTIGYLHDTKMENYPASDSLIVRINKNALDSLLTVTMIQSSVYPFILVNYSDVSMKVHLGQNSLEQPYSDFFTKSFIEESKRTGHFGVTNRPITESIYTLDISIDTCMTHSVYKRIIYVAFPYFRPFSNYKELGDPAETNLHVTATLKKGNSIIAVKKYDLSRSQPLLTTYKEGFDKFHSDFMVNMVQSLSLCTKQCIEEMVTDINNSLIQ